MARNSNRKASKKQRLAARLEMIRQRHWELILQPRKLIATDLDEEFGERFVELSEADELGLVETSQANRL